MRPLRKPLAVWNDCAATAGRCRDRPILVQLPCWIQLEGNAAVRLDVAIVLARVDGPDQRGRGRHYQHHSERYQQENDVHGPAAAAATGFSAASRAAFNITATELTDIPRAATHGAAGGRLRFLRHFIRKIYGEILADNNQMIDLVHWLGMNTRTCPEDQHLVEASRTP